MPRNCNKSCISHYKFCMVELIFIMYISSWQKFFLQFNDSTLPWLNVSRTSEALYIKSMMIYFDTKEFKLTNNGVQLHEAYSNFPWNLPAGSRVIRGSTHYSPVDLVMLGKKRVLEQAEEKNKTTVQFNFRNLIKC